MSTIQRSRRAALGVALVLVGALVTPLVVTAEEQTRTVTPVAPSWDETSGYGAVERSRATASAVLTGDPSWDTTSGYGAVERSRASASAMFAPSAISSQVSPDVRWAPGGMTASDLRSGRGSLRAADPAAAGSWDQTSGYGSVEASRAAASALLAPLHAPELAAPGCPPGAVIQTLGVPSDGTLVHSAALNTGQRYRLRASGVLISNRGTKLGVLAMDAGHRFVTRHGDITAGAHSLDGEVVGLAMADAAGTPDPLASWGAFTATHVYDQAITGEGDALAIRLQDTGTWTTITGALIVQIACA